ncbi:unnamed protein product [Ambrosiozyma monospora]|uniref:Unnamed protein product n=1 Tax=Ambrosiozyma monospora TaxID=43982 RepID=A0ACB5TLN4_AMBMO|nr:unnamed protein product [Ambrosiozyma monospora]
MWNVNRGYCSFDKLFDPSSSKLPNMTHLAEERIIQMQKFQAHQSELTQNPHNQQQGPRRMDQDSISNIPMDDESEKFTMLQNTFAVQIGNMKTLDSYLADIDDCGIETRSFTSSQPHQLHHHQNIHQQPPGGYPPQHIHSQGSSFTPTVPNSFNGLINRNPGSYGGQAQEAHPSNQQMNSPAYFPYAQHQQTQSQLHELGVAGGKQSLPAPQLPHGGIPPLPIGGHHGVGIVPNGVGGQFIGHSQQSADTVLIGSSQSEGTQSQSTQGTQGSQMQSLSSGSQSNGNPSQSQG